MTFIPLTPLRLGQQMLRNIEIQEDGSTPLWHRVLLRLPRYFSRICWNLITVAPTYRIGSIRMCGMGFLLHLAALKYSEIGLVKRMQKPSWSGSLGHELRAVSETIEKPQGELLKIPKCQVVLGYSLTGMCTLIDLYFDTFNLLYPLMERGELGKARSR
jgi:hypothetical protein